jgi:hypothetical protein
MSNCIFSLREKQQLPIFCLDQKTNYKSELRRKYYNISNNRKYFGPLPKLVTCDYHEIFIKNYYNSEEEQQEIVKQEKKENTLELLNQSKVVTKKIILNNTETKSTPIQQEKHIHTIKQNINHILKNQENTKQTKYTNNEIDKRRYDILEKTEIENKNIRKKIIPIE